MIYTVTLNPSLDYIVDVLDFKLNFTNRTSSELILPGGKGINVSLVLNNLNFKNIALGFTAGFIGDEIQNKLNDFGVNSQFIHSNNGVSRINVKIKNIDGTEINGQGPDFSTTDLDNLFEKLQTITENDIIILAGSIPASIPNTIYSDIMKLLPNTKVVVDATQNLLKNVLEHKPFLIKPNHHELSEIFNVKLTNHEDVIPYAKKLQEQGAVNVLVSLGSKGAVLVCETGEIYKSYPPKGQLVNSVGAGDSMVAGFIAGYLDKNDYNYAFKMSICTGSASAFSQNLATKDEVIALLDKFS